MYGIRILPLVREIQLAHPQVTQPWYSNNSGAGGSFLHIQSYLEDLMMQIPACVYLLEPTKIILVVSKNNFLRAQALFIGMVLRLVAGVRYLGGLIGYNITEVDWLGGKFRVCKGVVETLAGVDHRHPQAD